MELGKGTIHPRPRQRRTRRNGAQLLELGKVASIRRQQHRLVSPQWSPAFGAGKSRAGYLPRQVAEPSRNGAQLLELGKATTSMPKSSVSCCRNGAQLLELGKAAATPRYGRARPGRNGAQLLELGKELAIFSPTDYQCCTSLRAAEVLGQTSRVVAP